MSLNSAAIGPRARTRLPSICWVLPLWFLLGMTSLHAQSFVVQGRVIEGTEKEPLIGANIVEKGTTNGVTTDLDGRFSLEVSAAAATLVISYLGYDNQEVPIAGRSEIEIVLGENTKLLDEVVVTGYRREIRSDVSSAISSIKSKDIEKLVVVGIDQALQGQAPGIVVTQVTGAPGDDIAVRIRGAGSLGNNNPLYVVDGVPTTSNINMFSPSDIASIEILKDGAAAAIYGSRAANGVVLITTKRGQPGQTVFNFEAYTGIQQPIRLPELLNAEEFLTIRNEGITNANELRNPANILPTYDTAILDTLADTDWLGLVFAPAPMQRYSLSAMGGGEQSRFFISGEYLTQDGIYQGQGFDKYQLRINGDIGNDRFRIGSNLSFSATDRQVINSSGDGFGPGNEPSGIRYTLIASPLFPVYHPDGTLVKTSAELTDPTLFGDGNANPLAFNQNTDWTINRYRMFGSVFAELTLLDGLQLRTTLGGDLLFERSKLFKERLSPAIYDPTSLNEGRVFAQTLVWNNSINFQRDFGDHRISTLVGMEAIQNHTDYLGASANNFRRNDPLFRYIDASIPEEISNVGASGIATEWALLSYFGQFTYSYKRRYVVSTAIRRDGSSRFGKNNRWGTFPSVSAAWNISNEPWFANQDFISSLKLRASWGRLGNQEIGVYPFSSLVSVGDRVYVFGNNNSVATGANIVEIGNSNIRWETSTQTNFGMDVAFWGDRLSITADVFRKTTEDILVRVPVPQTGGATRPPFVNAASVQNEGLELGLIYKNRIGKVGYTIGANFTTLRNEVISIADSEPILGGFGLSDGPLTRTEPGRPVGSFYLWEMEGLFQSEEEIAASPFQSQFTRPGDVKFADLNGDNIIDDKDRKHVGNPFPDFTYGLNLGLNWEGFDFSMLVQGIQGNDVYFLYGNFAYETQLRGFNSYREILDRWTPTNTDTDIPRVSVDDRNGNRRPSTRFLEDGSYLRIRNISLGYDFAKLINNEQISTMRVYCTVQNALTLTNYPGLDPEIQANANDTQGLGISSDLAVGIDWGTVPAPRTIIAGVQLKF